MTDSFPNENNAAWAKVTPDVKHYLALNIYRINNIHFNNPLYYPVSEVDGFKKFFTPQVCYSFTVHQFVLDSWEWNLLFLYKSDKERIVTVFAIDVKGYIFNIPFPLYFR